MKVLNVTVSPATNRADAGLVVGVSLEVESLGRVLPIDVGGTVSSSGTTLATLRDAEAPAWPSITVTSLPDSHPAVAQSKQSPGRVELHLVADLSPRAIEVVEAARRGCTPKDAELVVHLWARTLAWTLAGYTVASAQVRAENGKSEQAFVKDERGTLALVAETSLGFAKADTRPLGDFRLLVPESRWVHEFAPALGLGKRVLVEMPEPGDLSGSPELADALQAAIQICVGRRPR